MSLVMVCGTNRNLISNITLTCEDLHSPRIPHNAPEEGRRIYCIIYNINFTITAEIHVRSLKFMRRVSEQEWAIRKFVIVKKQIDVSI